MFLPSLTFWQIDDPRLTTTQDYEYVSVCVVGVAYTIHLKIKKPNQNWFPWGVSFCFLPFVTFFYFFLLCFPACEFLRLIFHETTYAQTAMLFFFFFIFLLWNAKGQLLLYIAASGSRFLQIIYALKGKRFVTTHCSVLDVIFFTGVLTQYQKIVCHKRQGEFFLL